VKNSLILAILLLFSTNLAISQQYHQKNRKYKQEFKASTELGMMIGGSTFIIAGLLTNPVCKSPDYMTPKPILLQGPRTIAILGGGIVFIIGSAKLITQ